MSTTRVLRYDKPSERDLAEKMLLNDIMFSFVITLYAGIRTSIPFKKSVCVNINDLFRHEAMFPSEQRASHTEILEYLTYFVKEHSEFSDIFTVIKSYMNISEHVTFNVESCIDSMKDLTILYEWLKGYAKQKNLHQYFTKFISKLSSATFHNILCKEMINSDIITMWTESFMKFDKEGGTVNFTLNQSLLMSRFLFYSVRNNVELMKQSERLHKYYEQVGDIDERIEKFCTTGSWRYLFYIGTDTQCYISVLLRGADKPHEMRLISRDILCEFIKYYHIADMPSLGTKVLDSVKELAGKEWDIPPDDKENWIYVAPLMTARSWVTKLKNYGYPFNA